MNADHLTDDLKKKRAINGSFWLIGQPDEVVVSGVTVHGFDYYHTKMSNVEVNVATKIAMWMPTTIMKGAACFHAKYSSSQSVFKTAGRNLHSSMFLKTLTENLCHA